MAVKSVKLKLYFRKDQNQTYQHVWHTHKLFNEGVAYYTKQLLLLRQIPVADIVDPKGDLLRLARAAQSGNGKSRVGSDEDILSSLRSLYEEIIPACTGKKSNAQMLSRAFLSVLVDPKSIAGLGIAKKRKVHAEDEPAGNQLLINLKSGLGLLPLFKSYSDSLNNWTKRGVCTTWDRDMFQQAIERLCSWESWNIRVQTERVKLQANVEALINELSPIPDWATRIRQYEVERKIELNLISLPSDRPYRVLKSGIRGWRELREQWLAAEPKTKDVLTDIANDLQKEMRGDFGDSDVFHWLAHPENHFIWNCSEDRLTWFVKLNEAREKLDRAKEQAQLTLPDPIHHPVWARLDGPGGNLQWYSIQKSANDFSVSLVLLANEAGQIVERVVTIPIAWSAQFEKILIKDFKHIESELADQIAKQKNDNKVQWVEWLDKGTRHRFYGKLGGAKIQFERKALEKERSYYDTYINITINYIPVISDEITKAFTLVKPDETASWTVVDFKPDVFNQGNWISTQKVGLEGLKEGLRVMSVCLKLKTLAICSVFEVRKIATDFAIPIAGTDWYAVHQRSFLLRLPGEEERPEIIKKRQAIGQERQSLKNKLKKLSRILSLAMSSKKEDREEMIKLLKKADFVDEEKLITRIEQHISAKQEEWQEFILSIHRELEHDLGKELEAWRKKYRRKSSELRNVCGLSLWWIQELTDTRKLINGWSAHARTPREIVRARSLSGERKDKKAREVDLDKRLIQHINHLKDDRLKKGADAIVMAALGYQYSDKKQKWTVRHAPCRIILFQDISDFRMDRSLSRKDNAKLMSWAHRSLPRFVAHQGEVYGLITGIVRANNLSQIHAKTGSPAVRMTQVAEEYLDQLWFARNYLSELAKRRLMPKMERRAILDLPRSERKAKLLQLVKVGQFIPWESGELLCTKNGQGALKGNTLINGPQQIQRLFWQRQLMITKLYCIGADETGFAPLSVGKRLEASMGFGMLVRNPEGHYSWKNLTKRQYNVTVGKNTEDGSEEEEDILLTEEPDSVRVKQMFFRDMAQPDQWFKAEEFWRRVEKDLDDLLN